MWDDQGKPNPLPMGVRRLRRRPALPRHRQQGELWKWISKVAQKGADPDTVKDVTLIACDAEGAPCRSGS